MFPATKSLYLNALDLEHALEIGFDPSKFNAHTEDGMTVVDFATVEERAEWQSKITSAIWGTNVEIKEG